MNIYYNPHCYITQPDPPMASPTHVYIPNPRHWHSVGLLKLPATGRFPILLENESQMHGAGGGGVKEATSKQTINANDKHTHQISRDVKVNLHLFWDIGKYKCHIVSSQIDICAYSD